MKKRAGRRGAKRGRKGGRGPALERKARALAKAVLDVGGAARVKPGPILIGKTQRLSVRARSRKARVDSIHRQLLRVRKVGKLKAFSYAIRVRRPDGSTEIQVPRHIIPDIDRLAKRVRGRGKTARGRRRSVLKQFRAAIEEQISSEILRRSYERFHEVRAGSREKGRRYLDRLREGRGLTVEIEVYGEV